MTEPRGTAAARERLRIEAAVTEGLRLAQEAGHAEPALRDAVWELLLEAADTLRRLPDRERGWLTAAARAHWPDYLREPVAALTTAGGGSGQAKPGPARAGAIDRLDTVLAWLPHAGGARPRRDLAVLFGLASGLKVAALRRNLGCGRRTVYDIRDRALARICGRLRGQSAFCRGLK